MDSSTSTSAEMTLPAATRPRRKLSVEVILYFLIFALAVATRYAFLDTMALHQDEGTHAYYGWSIYTGQGWTHDGVYHGPLIYHMEALGFALFGDSDGTTRITLALFSVGTVILPVLLRRQLGRWGALIASFLLLISPSFLYFGRFGHPDVFGAFFTLLLFVCIVRYLAEPSGAPHRDRWFYGAVLAEALHFSAKPTAYLATGIFLLFLGTRLLWQRYGLRIFWLILGLFPAAVEDLWGDRFPLPQYQVGPLSLSAISLACLALTALVILGMLAWRWWEGWSQKKNDPTLDLVVVLGTMVVPLLAAIPLNVLVRLRHLEPLTYGSPDFPEAAVPLGILSIAACFLVAAVIGLRWDTRRWAISAAIFWGIFVVLYTSFFSSMTGWFTGLLQTLGFWMTQQNVKRIHTGPQYYTVMMAVYETVSLLFGTIAAVFFAWRGLIARPEQDPSTSVEQAPASPEARPLSPTLPLGAPPGVATSMLAFWSPVALLIFSLAGEQVPWLNIHPALPFVLLAGALLGRIVSFRSRRLRPAILVRYADLALLLPAGLLLAWAARPLPGQAPFSTVAWALSAAVLLFLAYLAFRGHGHGELAFAVLCAAIILMAILQAGAVSYTQQFAAWRPTVYVPLLLLGLTVAIRTALLGKVALRSAALVVLSLLCVYSVGSAFRLTYINNDTPVEFAVYVQTSPDISWVMDEIRVLSRLTTAGTNLGILYDTEVAWPLEWYLRNYPQRSRQTTIVGPPDSNVAVAVVDRDKDKISAPYLENQFYPYRYYAFNWWFGDGAFPTPSYMATWFDPEDQLDPATANLGTMARALWNPPGQARAWRYFLYREPAGPLGAREFVFYVRRDLVPQLELLRGEIAR